MKRLIQGGSLRGTPIRTMAASHACRTLHGWSVMLNSTVLIFGLGLLWITAMGLRL